VRTTNAIDQLHEKFKRRIKTQTVLRSAETAAILFWALLASGQITMRKVDAWQTLTQKLADKPLTLLPDPVSSPDRRSRQSIPTQIATVTPWHRQAPPADSANLSPIYPVNSATNLPGSYSETASRSLLWPKNTRSA
jgi:hypothetical protein